MFPSGCLCLFVFLVVCPLMRACHSTLHLHHGNELHTTCVFFHAPIEVCSPNHSSQLNVSKSSPIFARSLPTVLNPSLPFTCFLFLPVTWAFLSHFLQFFRSFFFLEVTKRLECVPPFIRMWVFVRCAMRLSAVNLAPNLSCQ